MKPFFCVSPLNTTQYKGYTTQPKGSFWCHVIDTKGAVLLLIFINKFVLVLYLSFSFRYVVELKLLQNLKNVKQPGLRYG